MDQNLTERLLEFEQELSYEFLDPKLLIKALTHSSCKNHLHYSNERLEFLGDAILSAIVTEYLFKSFPEKSEGELTRIRSIVVSRSSLAKTAKRLRIADFLILGKGLSKRKTLPGSMLANALEAVLAAIFLDSGMEEAHKFVLRILWEDIELAVSEGHRFNYKSILQQHAQAELAQTPTYRVEHEQGPDHVKFFTVVAVVGGEDKGKGSGPSKKEAEQRAAAETLRILEVDLAAGRAPSRS